VSQSFEVAAGTIGELFWNVSDAVLVGRTGRVMAWNPGAEAMLGMTAAEATSDDPDLARAFGVATDQFWQLVEAGDGKARLECSGGSGRILEATAWRLGGDRSAPTVMMLHDVTADERRVAGLSRLNSLARQLLEEQPLDALLEPIVDTAKELAAADFSAFLLLRPDSESEIAHFAYNAPRGLFPERLPRAVGLLAEPIRTRMVARIRDIRGHPQGVGIPVEHPPIAALLAVPILMGDRVLGELAVANSPESAAFDETDEALMRELAAHAAHAVTLATLRQAHHEEEERRRALLDDVSLHDIRTPLTVEYICSLHLV
jgi:PAS domain-containing protein